MPPSLTGDSAATDVVDGMSVWIGPVGPSHTPPPARNLSIPPAPYAIHPPRAGGGQPVEVTAENAAAHLDWLRQEVDRFNDFVAQQFDQIQRGREELARAASRAAAGSVTREQDFNRQQAAAAAQAAALERRREQELADRRAELERRIAEVERLETSLRRRLEEVNEVEDSLRAELEEREREVESGRRAVEEEVRQLRLRSSLPIDEPPADSFDSQYHG